MIASDPSSVGGGNSPRLSGLENLAVAICTSEQGACLMTEPVTTADLANVMSEAWRECCLRRGYADVALADTAMTLVPESISPASNHCRGYALEVVLPNGQKHRCGFSRYSLLHVATRAVRKLMALGQLGKDEEFHFELVRPTSSDRPALPAAAAACSVRINAAPLQSVSLPLSRLWPQAREVESESAGQFPVFFTEQSLAQADRCARRGAQATPAVETGGVLVGSLGCCPETREFFVVVTDVLEVQEAVQEEFSLTYSSQSWALIDRVLRARQTSHPEHGVRQLGQCHGHNFLPNGGQTCAACPTRPVCDSTSVFASSHDKTWMNAVYARQPWALCQIFGWTARSEVVSKLYGLSDGRWRPRGYHVLPNLPAELCYD